MRIPNSSQRQLIVGRTGSGKTRAGIWNLGMRNLAYMPWVVFNHKGEEFIDSIEGAHHVDINYIPKKPGLYIYHPIPEYDDEKVTKTLWGIHRKENCGIYIDEGYMISRRDPAMQAILTQGRSKHIPMIILSQRPVFLTRFAVSESDFYQIFQLQDKDDRDRIKSFIPTNLEYWMACPVNEQPKLPQYHSLYFDVGKNRLEMIKPVPSDEILRERIEGQLKKQKHKRFFFF